MPSNLDFDKKIDRILIFDWDGVICKSDHHAVESMRYATQQLCETYGLRYSETNLQQALRTSSGTTEQTFLTQYLILSNPTRTIRNHGLETEFLDINRREYWKLLNINDQYNIYPDFLQLLRRCKAVDKVEHKTTIYAIGTGNPDLTFEQRLPEELAKEFNIIVGGVKDTRRFELVSRIFHEKIVNVYSWNKHQDSKYIPWRDFFRHTVVYYFDDTERAITDVSKGYNKETIGSHNVNVPNLRLIHVDRENKHQSDFGALKNHNLLLQVRLLNDYRLFSFLNPRSHEPLEGKFIDEELKIRQLKHKEY